MPTDIPAEYPRPPGSTSGTSIPDHRLDRLLSRAVVGDEPGRDFAVTDQGDEVGEPVPHGSDRRALPLSGWHTQEAVDLREEWIVRQGLWRTDGTVSLDRWPRMRWTGGTPLYAQQVAIERDEEMPSARTPRTHPIDQPSRLLGRCVKRGMMPCR